MKINHLLFAGVIFLSLGSVYYWLSAATMSNDTKYIPVGFSAAGAGQVELCVAVGMLMPREDGPKLKNGQIQWDEWVDTHFDLRVPNGVKVPFRRNHFSKSISEQTAGTPEFFILAKLPAGAACTLDYIPVVGRGDAFRYEFTTPAGDQAGERVAFVQRVIE